MSGTLLLALDSINWPGQSGGGVWQDSTQAEKQHEFTMIILFSTSLILLLWLIARIQRRISVSQAPRRPWHVFRSLLKHHGLGLSDRLLLIAIARSHRLKQPVLLLLSPGLFTRHAMEWLSESRLASMWPGAKERLTQIAQQIFTESPSPQ
jgi:hypothetical protein